MTRFYTQTINLASILINVYQTKGTYNFKGELEKMTSLVTENCGDDILEASKRLTSLASNVFSHILEGKKETILNYTIEISETCKQVEKIEDLETAFLTKFHSILEENESSSCKFSEEVIQYLKSCPEKELKQITTQILADNFQYSPTYFPKKFIEEQGITIHEAIIYEKVNRAFKLLKSKDNNHSIKEISSILGFSDQRYFSKLFKNKFGVLPSDVSKLRKQS